MFAKFFLYKDLNKVAAVHPNSLMYIMKHTQIKGGKQSGKEADKDNAWQNIHKKRRMFRIGNTVLGNTATEEEFGKGNVRRIDIVGKKRQKTSFGDVLVNDWTSCCRPCNTVAVCVLRAISFTDLNSSYFILLSFL